MSIDYLNHRLLIKKNCASTDRRQLRCAMKGVWILFLAMKALRAMRRNFQANENVLNFGTNTLIVTPKTCEPCSSNIYWDYPTKCAKWIFLKFCLSFVTSTTSKLTSTKSSSSITSSFSTVSGMILSYSGRIILHPMCSRVRMLMKYEQASIVLKVLLQYMFY